MRGQRGRVAGGPEGEIDEAFWAQAAASQAEGADESKYRTSLCLFVTHIVRFC